MDIQNPEKIEIEGLKTIHKLCKFGEDHNMEGCSFTEIVERMFSKIEQMKTQVNTLDEILLNQGEALAQTKAQAVPETLKNDCMIGQTWFMKGTSVSALIEYAENVYKAEAVAQNSKIEFGTDDNEHWFAHDVPFYGTVQIDRIEEHGLVEWDIHFNGCWQGPFNSKSECIKHLEECISEEREEAKDPAND